MRDIIFRAKSKIDGGWAIGSVFHNKEMTEVLIRTATDDYAVNPETVGQYTGLTDKNGTKIFEGDLCLCDRNINDRFDKIIFEIKFDEHCGFYGENFDEIEAFEFCMCEVIGNIYDNPEMLKGEGKE